MGLAIALLVFGALLALCTGSLIWWLALRLSGSDADADAALMGEVDRIAPRTPIRIVIGRRVMLALPDIVRRFEAAAQQLNEATGLQIFALGGEQYATILRVEPMDNATTPARARVRLSRGALIGATIYLDVDWAYAETSTLVLDRVIMHEIGHALGLDHDRDPRSVMHPKPIDQAYVLTAQDRTALAAAYARVTDRLDGSTRG